MRNDIATNCNRLENSYQQFRSKCSKLYDMILQYLSEEFYNGSSYIDRLPGDGIVLVTEFESGSKIYPMNQINALIKVGVPKIHPNDLIAI